jgi:hypothetical protein
MPVFTQGDNSCYFVHIPRTAGRYVSELFEDAPGIRSKHTGRYPNPRYTYGVYTPHLHYPLYCDICPDDIPHITIVRNPYDKFISALRVMNARCGVDFDPMLRDEFECFRFIFIQILNRCSDNNWFLPQHRFISPNTFVWKYESGFGEDFQRWVEKKTGIKLNMTDPEYKMISGEEDNRNYTISEKSAINVKKFYHQDYSDFNY